MSTATGPIRFRAQLPASAPAHKRYPSSVAVYELSPVEIASIAQLLGDLVRLVDRADDPEFLAEASRAAVALPVPLVRFLDAFKRLETSSAVVVCGLPVDDGAIGRTPSSWNRQEEARSTLREEIFFVLTASLLGDPFGWSTLQEGRIIHNVVPIRGEEDQQSGHGSTTTLAWHSEDGFHPYRCDYLGLMALRNHDRVPTTLASVGDVEIDEEERLVLSEDRFCIAPDDEHDRQGAQQEARYRWRPEVWREPPPTAVLFGDLAQPYLRIDPYFMRALPGDAVAARALDAIVTRLDRALLDLVLEAGDVCFIDNYRAVHGRRAFEPRYDGSDRWLKKIGLTRDLRRSRAARDSVGSRVVNPSSIPVGAGAAAGMVTR